MSVGGGNLPERPGDTVLPSNIGGLEQSSGPSPLRNDDGGGEPSLDHATGRAARKVENKRYCENSALKTRKATSGKVVVP